MSGAWNALSCPRNFHWAQKQNHQPRPHHDRNEGVNATGIRVGLLDSRWRNKRDNGNNTIRNEGDIQTAGANAAGIQAVGKNNSVTNTGAIRATGQGAAGLLAVPVVPVNADGTGLVSSLGFTLRPTDIALTNTGLTTTGASAPGIRVSDKTKVNHEGGLAVSG